jgi:hypothetical protein
VSQAGNDRGLLYFGAPRDIRGPLAVNAGATAPALQRQ